MPVVEDTIGILSNADDKESDDESNAKSLDLLNGIVSTRADGVHGSNGHGSGGRSREHKVQLAGDVDDEESSKRDGGEKTEEGADEGDGENATEILLRVVRHEVQAVHGGETSDEDTGHTTSTGGSGLDDRVLLGTELATEKRNVGQGLGQHEDETITEDGTEHSSGEGEASLETYRSC